MDIAENKKRIEEIYKAVIKNPVDIWNKNNLEKNWTEQINKFIDEIIIVDENPIINDKKLIKKIGELLFLSIASKNKNSQKQYFNESILKTLRDLRINSNIISDLLTQSIWEGIMIGLDALYDDTIQSIIDELALITSTDIGNSTIRNSSKSIKQKADPQFFRFLNTTISKEVISFLNERHEKSIPTIVKNLINEISSPVISVASRKGGTGKTTFLLNLINWFYERVPEGKACIIDLDLSGPVWLYLLADKNQLNNIKASNNFLDIFFNTKNAVNDPFGLKIDINPDISDVYSIVHNFKWPFNKTESKIGLCSFKDFPYSNRQIDSALNYNRDKLYPFLINFVKHLSIKYDLILIDSGPGFSAIPYCSLSIAGIAKNSIPAVISSPALCDIYGTLMEFADLRFVNLSRPPLWWINKVNGQEYFNKDLNWYTLSKDLGFTQLLPQLSLIEKILKYKSEQGKMYTWNKLPFDDKISQIGSITPDGNVDTPELNYENSKYYHAICNYFDNEYTELLDILKSKKL